MKATMFHSVLLSGFAAMLVAAQAQATVVTGVTVQSFSNQFASDGRFAVNSINGNGLDPSATDVLTAKHNGVPGSLNTGYSTSDGMWLAGSTTANIVYNLGAVYTIDKLYVWNYAESYAGDSVNDRDRSAQSVDIYADNTTNPATLIQNFTFLQAPDISGGTAAGPNNFIVSYDVPAVAYTFSSPITAQYIKLDILSNYGDGFGVGLAEIRFNEFVAAPEPMSAVLMLVGMIGMYVFRRNQGR